MLFPLAIIISGLGSVAAKTAYADDDPNSCKIIGDPNMYGLGIRIGLYLHYLAVVLAALLAPDQVKKICLTFCAIGFVSLAGVYRNASNGAFIALEWQIMLLLTLSLGWATFNFNPTARNVDLEDFRMWHCIIPPSGGKLKRSYHGPFGILNLLFAIYLSSVAYMYWKGNYIGRKEGCEVKIFVWIFFYGFWVNLYNPKWVIFAKICGVAAVFLALMITVCAFAMLLGVGFFRILREEDGGRPSRWSIGVCTAAQVYAGMWIILQVELTLKNNKVDLSQIPLHTTGQLIPLLMGIMMG
ncbi:hypothetical protein FMUND_11016 [Fusarium mundagurra]|uniref:Uncharacterized protein n=1 Tax=Fusarium mundagurra TaxID=1567541 RepID=A0A8H5YA82_9HYPO|nr:hypothetical protein FMUND_11016 [Fusarium mundagurra]